MKLVTLEKLIWVLIYGGLLLLSLGVFVSDRSTGLGRALMLGGAAGAVAGAVLVYVRSRMSTPSTEKRP